MADRDLLSLRLREHLALDDLTHWSANPADLRVLRISAAVARLLAGMGYGADELPELDKAEAVLRQRRADAPGITGVCQADLPALRWLLAFADAQRTACTAAEYHRALGRVREDHHLGGHPCG